MLKSLFYWQERHGGPFIPFKSKPLSWLSKPCRGWRDMGLLQPAAGNLDTRLLLTTHTTHNIEVESLENPFRIRGLRAEKPPISLCTENPSHHILAYRLVYNKIRLEIKLVFILSYPSWCCGRGPAMQSFDVLFVCTYIISWESVYWLVKLDASTSMWPSQHAYLPRNQWAWFNIKMFYQYTNPIVEIKQSWDCMISTVGFTIPVRNNFYIESRPCYL